MIDEPIDYVLYCDTDSIFYSIESFIENNTGLTKWNTLTVDEKILYSKRIAGVVNKYVNDNTHKVVQNKDFNSYHENFKIVFEQEIIASTGLFVAKKKYGLKIVDKNGISKDELFVKGLEIIQSLTPIAIKHRLRNMMQLILSGESDKNISKTIRKDKKELLSSHPNEIAVNVTAKNLSKYIINGKAIKGTPWSLKGINNYHNIIKELELVEKYGKIDSVGNKIRIVYIREPNTYNMETIGFIRWPEEFNEIDIKIDYDKMIEKFYMQKIKNLLEPISKGHLVSGGGIESMFN